MQKAKTMTLAETRVVNRRRDRYDVYIGRPSFWGNPFVVGSQGDRGECVRLYEAWLRQHPDVIEAAKRELRGKVLGCYCARKGGVGPDDPLVCHGQILARAARGDYDDRIGGNRIG
jgi:hypothetical protein